METVLLRTSGGAEVRAAVARVADFFGWINERHAIYLRRKRGDLKPWTDDPVLMRYKFTNAFRELDRGTVWLREHIRDPFASDDPALLLFNIVAYREFNWWPTGEFLLKLHRGLIRRWDPERVRTALTKHQDGGHQIFTGAHIVRSHNGIPKIDSVCRILTPIWRDREKLAADFRAHGTLEHAFNRFLEYEMIGDFMAYEFVTDLRWTAVFTPPPTDVMTWANAGPGATRGLRRLFPTRTDWSRTGKTALMRELLAMSPKHLAEWVPPLEMRDIEHSLCEADKYFRAKYGEGRPRSMYPGAE